MVMNGRFPTDMNIMISETNIPFLFLLGLRNILSLRVHYNCFRFSGQIPTVESEREDGFRLGTTAVADVKANNAILMIGPRAHFKNDVGCRKLIASVNQYTAAKKKRKYACVARWGVFQLSFKKILNNTYWIIARKIEIIWTDGRTNRQTYWRRWRYYPFGFRGRWGRNALFSRYAVCYIECLTK